jgi:hypothetical protein
MHKNNNHVASSHSTTAATRVFHIYMCSLHVLISVARILHTHAGTNIDIPVRLMSAQVVMLVISTRMRFADVNTVLVGISVNKHKTFLTFGNFKQKY